MSERVNKNHLLKMSGLLLLLFSTSGHSIVMSNEVFQKNGGNLNDVRGTINRAYAPLIEKSHAYPFQIVGYINDTNANCTASWLGEDEKKTYILTAAHCLNYGNNLTAPWSGRFFDRNGELLARNGVMHIHPYRLNSPPGHGGASTDIAVIVADKIKPMLDDRNQPAQQPWLYDGSNELNHTVTFVGNGLWGIRNPGSQTFVLPRYPQRRAWGQSYVNGIWEADHGIGAPFVPERDAKSWARVASGDSGSAWWQQQHGFWTIIATTNGGHANLSTGARVSKYISWIKSVYPQAATLQDKTTVTENNTLILPDFSRELDHGSVAYIVPHQENADGPGGLINEDNSGVSQITVKLKQQADEQEHEVVLRAWRETGCEQTAMNNAHTCDKGSSVLKLRYDDQDNPDLPSGKYSGAFKLEAKGWEEGKYINTVDLQANIEKKEHAGEHIIVSKPVAVAGKNFTVTAGTDTAQSYPLDARASQNAVSYRWTISRGAGTFWLQAIQGSQSVSEVNGPTARAVIPANTEGQATYRLTVRGKDGSVDSSEITVTVNRAIAPVPPAPPAVVPAPPAPPAVVPAPPANVAPAYNSRIAYPTRCTRVSHNGQVWFNQWYVNPGQEEPGKGGTWGVWRTQNMSSNNCR